LKIRPPELPDFEVSSRELGSLAHQILREFYSKPVPASESDAIQRMQEVIDRHLAAVDINGQGPNSVIDPSLWRISRPQLVRALIEYVRFAVRDAGDGFETLQEYLDRSLPAAKLGEITLGGRPDHIAVRRTAGRISGIRVDDFKYSAASSSTNSQLQRSFQVPVYAHLTAAALQAEPDVTIEGRYLLLRSPSKPVVAREIDSESIDDVRRRIDELLEKVKNGWLHPDPPDKSICATCEYRRMCRLYGG
jgi:CRISPR/Cas system-associated exonuclease Cas4 (RecB family)